MTKRTALAWGELRTDNGVLIQQGDTSDHDGGRANYRDHLA